MYFWLNFLPQWNGTCCILQTQWTTSPAHRCFWYTLLGGPTCQADQSIHNGQQSMPRRHSMERTLCHCCSSQHIGPPLAKEESVILLRQPVSIQYKAKGVY